MLSGSRCHHEKIPKLLVQRQGAPSAGFELNRHAQLLNDASGLLLVHYEAVAAKDIPASFAQLFCASINLRATRRAYQPQVNVSSTL